jgi:hypothetical protein
MRYNERCTIIVREEIEGYLGTKETNKKLDVVCAASSFSVKDQSVEFGSFKKLGYRIHIQGHYKVDRIIYNGMEYQPFVQYFHHNSTVLEVG